MAAAAEEIILQPHQIPHVKRILEIFQENLQILDQSYTGSGKTYTTLYVALMLNIQIFVICPLIMIDKWRDLALKFNVRIFEIMTYQKLAGRTKVFSHPYLEYRETTISATDSFLKLLSETPMLLVVDEVHYGKNMNSLRTQAVCALTEALVKVGGQSRIILLSATPFDKETNAESLIRMLGFLFGTAYEYDARHHFLELTGAIRAVRFCQLWNPVEAEKVISPYLVKELPQFYYEMLERIFLPRLSVTMKAQLRPKELKYDIANGFYDFDKDSLRELQDAEHLLRKSVKGDADHHFIDFKAFGEAMVKLEHSKLNTMARLAQQELEKDPNCKVILAVNYVENMRLLEHAFKPYGSCLLYGEVKPKDRLQILKDFQEANTKIRVMVINPSVGGVGIDLDDTSGLYPRHLFIIPTFELIKIAQMAGRILRTGTLSQPHLRVIYAKAFEDECKILHSLFRKSKVMKGITKSEDVSLFPGHYPGIVE